MDPSPPPAISLAPIPVVPAATSIHPDAVEPYPGFRNGDANDNTLPQVPGAKLRLMCSYGGHIIPRPHDKALCYVGGDTRLVVVDRLSSLSSLCSRLSSSIFHGRPFMLKYQLPNEDLDSLVSITTDEDLENMIEEYDRLMATTEGSSLQTSSRIRLFVFFNKPETAASMGSFLGDAKSETLFVDALNGSGLLPRGLSDSTMDCLLNLDNENVIEEAQPSAESADQGQVKINVAHDVQFSLPDSPMVETSSSFGSSSSSPSMSNLPPIRVRVVEDQRNGGIEEQFAQMSVGFSGGCAYSPHPMPMNPLPPMPGDNTVRGLPDDERSDPGIPLRFRKPPLPNLQPVQYNNKASAVYNLPSPDSVASDSSIASASSLSKPNYHNQDQVGAAAGETRGPTSPNTTQMQDSGYVLPAQMDQQQQQQQHFVHASMHYIPHPSSYYPVYATPPQQQMHHPTDRQYPFYVLPVGQPQAQYMSMQPNMAETNAAPSRQVSFKDGTPPVYPTKTATQAKPEMAANVYRTTVAPIPANQYQQQFVGYSQMQHPFQSVAANAGYGYDYAHPVTGEQVFYTQHQAAAAAAPLTSQYQTMTSASAVAALADASKQLPADNSNQQIRTSQP